MDLRGLTIFMEAAELGSFTRAGEKLGYSQPTVSFQIKQLEQELGVPLFERIGHTITLTEEGRFALGYAHQIVRSCQEMVKGPESSQIPSGIIRLATADSLCARLMSRHFGAFRRNYPQVMLQVQTAGTTQLLQLLDHNETDVLCTLDRHIFDTNYIIASEERIPVHFVASPMHPLAKASEIEIHRLLEEPFLLTERDTSYCRMLHERLAQDSLEIHPILESGNADLLCQLAEQNLGISVLPDFVTEEARSRGTLVYLPVREFEIEVWKQIIYRREKWVTLPMKALISHLSRIHLGGVED